MKHLIWTAPERIHFKRGLLWYVFMILLTAGLLFYAFREGSWSFAIAILISIGVYRLLYHEKPKELTVTLSKQGIEINSHKMPFSTLKSFWIQEDTPLRALLTLRSHSRLSPDFHISLANKDPSEVRMFLKQFVPEAETYERPFTDHLIQLLKL